MNQPDKKEDRKKPQKTEVDPHALFILETESIRIVVGEVFIRFLMSALFCGGIGIEHLLKLLGKS